MVVLKSNNKNNGSAYDGFDLPLINPGFQQQKKSAPIQSYDCHYDYVPMTSVQIHSDESSSDPDYCYMKKTDGYSSCDTGRTEKVVFKYKFRISPLFGLFLCLSTIYFGSKVLPFKNLFNSSDGSIPLTMEEKEIQRESREKVLEKFGPGPHFVHFDLDFANADGDSTVVASSFVVKLAPLSEMPHSVYTFLEMVSNGLWDGCSFSINGGHLLMASPMEYDGKHANVMRRFREADLLAPSFSEYSASYPHRKYTLGFIGTRSGPEFYINTEDNTHIHGPGKQDHHQHEHHAEPCFGTIVSGFDSIKRMQRLPLSHGVWFNAPVGIRKAYVLSSP